MSTKALAQADGDPGVEWVPISKDLPDHDVVVMTKISDKDGDRNEQPLRRRGAMWFFEDGSMYVYYRPTHWRPLV